MSGRLRQEPAHEREVLFAVALVEPLTGDLVRRGMRVRAEGLHAKPVVNFSGHFVFLGEGGATATSVEVEPAGAPFGPARSRPPARGLPEPLLLVRLRPTPAYPFPAYATLPRAQLVKDGAPVADVTVTAALGTAATCPGAATDANGEFALMLRFREPQVAGERQQVPLTLVFTDLSGTERRQAGLKVDRGGRQFLDAGENPKQRFVWSELSTP